MISGVFTEIKKKHSNRVVDVDWVLMGSLESLTGRFAFTISLAQMSRRSGRRI